MGPRPSVTPLLLPVAVLVALTGAPLAGQSAGSHVARATALFEAYTQAERAFNPAIVDLYAPDALIRNTRRYPDGTTRVLTLTTAQLRKMLALAFPVARQAGDTNTYSAVSYAIEGAGVRIQGDRAADRKGYHGPFSLLVRPTAAGVWLIVEDLTESQP